MEEAPVSPMPGRGKGSGPAPRKTAMEFRVTRIRETYSLVEKSRWFGRRFGKTEKERIPIQYNLPNVKILRPKYLIVRHDGS